MKAILIILLAVSFMNVAFAQTEPFVNQELPNGFFYNISPIVVNQETGKTDYVFSGILLTLDVANVADLVFTKRVLAKKDGNYFEANPIMREALRNEPLDWALKLGSTAILNYILKVAYEKNTTIAYVAALLIGSSYSYLAFHNYQLAVKIGM
jgi:hypothetical protein